MRGYVELSRQHGRVLIWTASDPAEGNVQLPKILLNGNNICMVRSKRDQDMAKRC